MNKIKVVGKYKIIKNLENILREEECMMKSYIDQDGYPNDEYDEMQDYYSDDNYGECSRCGNKDYLKENNLCSYCNDVWE